MLILSRGKGERIRLKLPDGGEVWILIDDIRGNKVRVGIEAEQDVVIQREEIVPPEERR